MRKKVSLLTVIFESLSNWYCFLLKYEERTFIKSTDYLFQLVSVRVSTCRKKARNKRKQIPLGGKSFSIGTKSFPNKIVSTNFSKGFHSYKKNHITENCFHKIENTSSPYRMKNSFKNTFSLDKI